MRQAVEVALVGCGAIAQRGYLPALALVREVRCRWLVDAQKGTAETLARRFGIAGATDDYLSVLDRVEAVVLAAPNHCHARLSLEALERGRAVLCEKPLGRTAEEIRQMVLASERAGVPLVAGMVFRQYPELQQIRAVFPWSALGAVREIRASYGNPLDWPVSRLTFFDREMAGGGVFLDLGVHLIDCLLWLLSLPEASVLEYLDDSESGVESEARATLAVRATQGAGLAPCWLEVSRLRRLPNRVEIFGERGSLSIFLAGGRVPEIRDTNGTLPRPVFSVMPPGVNVFAEQLRAFAQRVRGLDANCADGRSQLRVLELVESCYMKRKPISFPWEAYEPWTPR